MLGDMNSTNDELVRGMEALETSVRSKDRAAWSADRKAKESEQTLVGAGQGSKRWLDERVGGCLRETKDGWVR